MSILVDLLILLPIVLVMAYFGLSPSLLLFGIILAILFLFLSIGGVAGLSMASADSGLKMSMTFWTPFLITLGLLAFSVAILIPTSHLAGYISALDVLAFWFIEVVFFFAFLSIQGRYYGNLQAERHKEWDKNAPTAENPIVTEVTQHINARTGKVVSSRRTRRYRPSPKRETWADFFRNKAVFAFVIVQFITVLLAGYLLLFGFITFLEFIGLSSSPFYLLIYIFMRANIFPQK
jgi:hypothetical protein